MPYVGKCLCGQCTVTISSTHDNQVLCHCIDCKKTSGGAFTTNILAAKKDVKIEGPTGYYEAKGDSGNMVGRIFCSNCGCAFSHTSAVFGDAQAIQTGIFPEFSKVPVAVEIYIKDRWTGLAPIPGAAQFQAGPPA